MATAGNSRECFKNAPESNFANCNQGTVLKRKSIVTAFFSDPNPNLRREAESKEKRIVENQLGKSNLMSALETIVNHEKVQE